MDLLEDDYEDDDDLECLEEANSPKGFDSIVGNMFGHLLKFKHQSDKQTSMWVKTINRNSTDIIKLYPKLRPTDRSDITNNIDSYLDDRFEDGLNLFRSDTGLELNIPRYRDWDFDFIFNRARIKEFLLKNLNRRNKIDISVERTIYESFR